MKTKPMLISMLLILCMIFTLQCRQITESKKTFVRKNINDLDPSSLESIKRGMKVMMERDTNDPTSWVYQARIHGVPDNIKERLPGWDQCTHMNYYFLAWHRMYIYYFERILRKAANDPKLTLPYWNYSDPLSRDFPEFFRNFPPEIHRNIGLDDGLCCLQHKVVDASLAMSQEYFYSEDDDTISGANWPRYRAVNQSFGGAYATPWDTTIKYFGTLENKPHNLIHLAIGGINWKTDTTYEAVGEMAFVELAALDPIFWLHHSNIDRLWNTWVSIGHSNPTADRSWMEQEFMFFDENGDSIKQRIKDFINTKDQLNYIYDTDDSQYFENIKDEKTSTNDRPIISKKLVPIAKNSNRKNIKNVIEKINIPFEGLFSPPELGNNEYVLVLDSINVDRDFDPRGIFEVYINLPENVGIDSLLLNDYIDHYIGSIGFFGANHKHSGHGSKINYLAQSFDATQQIKTHLLSETGEDLKISIVRDLGLTPCNSTHAQSPIENPCFQQLKGRVEELANRKGFVFNRAVIVSLTKNP